jgi:sterol desaturase/sphingolipid hydroxylase (fatty acid hydroxylase superfamily)
MAMDELLLAHQNAIRLVVFFGIFAVMASWEIVAARRPRGATRGRRWPGNIGIVVLNTLLLRLAFPLTAVAWAEFVAARGIGVLNLVPLPAVVALPLAVLLLDLAIWAQHVVFHRVPLLWRLHRMHHADIDLDVTSGARFHPIEILLSMIVKFAVIALLGAPAAAVLVFEVLLNACAMFNHANVRIAGPVDALLRRLIVTPDMHRVHHSVVPAETDSNFGFCLSCWDRIFATYRAEPAAGQLGMTIGLETFRAPDEARLDRLITQPFRNDQAVAAP